MERISRQQMFMQMAEVAALRSTCSRGNVGCLVVMDNDILSMGYNGPPAGDDHCKGNLCERSSNGGCLRSIHAEVNALDRAMAKELPVSNGGWDLYCTMQPCFHCAVEIVGSPVTRMFYRHPYRLPDGLEALGRGGVKVYRVTPSGLIIEGATGLILDPKDL